MRRYNVLIAEENIEYISSLELLLLTHEDKSINLEIITDEEYLQKFLNLSSKIDCLIIDENWFENEIFRHQIGNIFILLEKSERKNSSYSDNNIEIIDKYAGVREIFHKIIGKLDLPTDDRNIEKNKSKTTNIILVNSQIGGLGKTTISYALALQLSELNRSVLYISLDSLQKNQIPLEVKEKIPDGIDCLLKARDEKFTDYMDKLVKHFEFDYFLPWNGSRMALNLDEDDYEYLIDIIKNTHKYDYIILDSENGLNRFTLRLMSKCDDVFEIIDQTYCSEIILHDMRKEIRVSENDKFTYICNKYDKRNENFISYDVLEYIPFINAESYLSFDLLKKMHIMKNVALLLV